MEGSVPMNRGFTIIELLIVVIIVGLLAAMAIPNLKDPLERGRAKNAIFNLQAIYHSQKRFKLAEKTFFYTPAGDRTGIINAINENLTLNIKDDFFDYKIIKRSTEGFNATAVRRACKGCKCENKALYITDINSTVIKKGCAIW